MSLSWRWGNGTAAGEPLGPGAVGESACLPGLLWGRFLGFDIPVPIDARAELVATGATPPAGG